MKSKRQAVREAQARQSRISTIIAVVGIVLLAIVIGYFVVTSVIAPKPTATVIPTQVAEKDMIGEFIGPTGANDHIPDESTDPNPYSSNPPSSGHHFGRWLNAGFYDTNAEKYPEGHLVHNLEHGYIIFWYNCKVLSDAECATLKTQIKDAMSAAGNFKVIAYPWEKTDVPLVLTSWGYRLSFESFDANLVKTFIDQHRNRAPEPNAP